MPSSDDAEIQSPIEEEKNSHSSDHPMDNAEEEGDVSSEKPNGKEDADDADQEIGSEGHGEDLTSACSSPEKTEAIPASDSHSVENDGVDNISLDHSNVLTAIHPNDGDAEPSGLGKPVISASEDNGTPESPVGSKIEAMPEIEEKSSPEVPENAQTDKTEQLGAIKASLSVDALIGGDEPENETKSSPLPTLQIPVDSKLSSPSSQNPRQRPRSESLEAEVEKINKRPALVCEFFAKGWCIKGKSCRFLHQKDGVVNAVQQTIGDLSGASWKGEPQEITGMRREAINTSGSSKSVFQQFPEDHKFISIQRQDLSSGMLPRRDFQPFPLARDDSRLDSSVSRDIYREIPRRDFLMDNLKSHSLNRYDISPPPMVREDSKVYGRSSYIPSFHGKHLHDETFDRGSPIERNNSVSQYGFFSLGSSMPSNMYDNYTSRFPSSSLNSSSNTTFSTSLQSTLISPSHSLFGLPGSLSTHGSTPLSADHLGVSMKFRETEAGYSVSGSTPLKPPSSSPSFLRPGADNLPGSEGNITYPRSSSWEPSVPFRSSFVNPSADASSPGSQYDPLRDSIEPPPNGGKGKEIQNMLPGQTNGDHAITGERGLLPPLQFIDSLLEKNFHGDGVYLPTVEVVAEKENRRSMPKEETEPVDVNLTHQTEGARGVKDSKTVKYFRAALVDFVKELVKPSWRGGHLSKDAHKTIVKKAVDKVLGALQHHQIPSTPDSVNQYLSSCRPKLVKLVEGYVDKYAKE